VKPKFHYADFRWNFLAGKVVNTNHESRWHKRWQIMKSWSFGDTKQSRHVKMFAMKFVTSSRQTRLCRSNIIWSVTVHEESRRQSLWTLSQTQITKVHDTSWKLVTWFVSWTFMICVYNFVGNLSQTLSQSRCNGIWALANRVSFFVFSPPENDSFRKDLCFTHDVFFFVNAKSPRQVGRPAWNFARWSGLGTIL